MAYDTCRFPALFLRKTGPLELYGLPANSRRVNLGDFGNYDRLQTGSGFQNKFYGLGLFDRAFFLVLGSCTLRRWCVSVWMRILLRSCWSIFREGWRLCGYPGGLREFWMSTSGLFRLL